MADNVEAVSMRSCDSSQPGVLTSCQGSNVHSASMVPSPASGFNELSLDPRETPRQKLHSSPPPSSPPGRSNSLSDVGLSFFGQISGCVVGGRSQSEPNMQQGNFDRTGSMMSMEQPQEQRKRIIIMHTSADEEPARQLHKKIAKSLKSKTTKQLFMWDDVCPGGGDVRRAEERIDAEPTVLVFCVTVGFVQSYRSHKNTATPTNAMYDIMERALQTTSKHYVIPVRSSTSLQLTEDDICEILPSRKCLFEENRKFDEKIKMSLMAAGMHVKNTSIFSRKKKYFKF